MQVDSLFPRLLHMSREEQLSFIAEVRKRKHEVRPAEQKRKAKAKKKESKPKVNKTLDLLSKLSEEEKAAILAMLDDEEDSGE